MKSSGAGGCAAALNFVPLWALSVRPNRAETPMAQSRNVNPDFTRAFGDAKKQASDVVGDAADAAQDLYGQARDSASDLADSAQRAARRTAGSFEQALRNTIETQPYTAVFIALGLGWLLGRMHRPL
jgi:ElaB/YqjD/DUF883 family membrane-anchored ribosome-binding protein